MLLKLRQLRRGLEPLVAAVLLVVTTLAAGLAVYLWSSNFVQGTAAQTPSLGTALVLGTPLYVIGDFDASGAYDDVNITVFLSVPSTSQNFAVLSITCYDALSGEVLLSPLLAASFSCQSPVPKGSAFMITCTFSNVTKSITGVRRVYCEVTTDRYGSVVTPIFMLVNETG